MFGRKRKPESPQRQRVASIDTLEARTFLSASVGVSSIVMHPNLQVLGNASLNSTVTGFTPSQIRKAYGFDQISFGDGTKADGTGQTIAIVDAYNHPNIASDLHIFNLQFGLPDTNLTVVNQTGGSRLPATDSGWAGEIALDVEWAHAIAPGAKILLVEADSANTDDLMTAVDYARHAAGVSVVSMSWGGSEFVSWGGGGESQSQLQNDKTFATPTGHTGVTFVAASGDSGTSGGVQWPASSPNVVSVGGTSLTTNSNGTYASEGPWRGFRNGTSGGFSNIEAEPAYQQVAQQTGSRSTPDVGYNGDPATGFAVYDSIPDDNGDTGWNVIGGTSAGSPQWAALIAIANQGRQKVGLGTLDGLTQTLPSLYSVYSAPNTDGYANYTSHFNDIGNDGYGYTTGLGSPKAAAVVSTLIGKTAPVVTNPGTDSGTDTTTPLPASPLAVTFSTVPISGVEGETGSVKVRIADLNGSGFSGPVTVKLYASTDGTVSTDDTTITTLTIPNLKLHDLGAKKLKLKFTFPTGLADGTYTLIATANATATTSADAVVTSTLALANPKVDLAAAFASDQPIIARSGRSTSVVLNLTNIGNITASGTYAIKVYTSSDGTLDDADTLLITLPEKKLKLLAGKSKRIKVRVAIPDTFTGGAFSLLASVVSTTTTADTNAANDVAVATIA